MTRAELADQRQPGMADDVHFCESLAERFIEELTEPGDLVLDPFAGYGTSLVVADRLDRQSIGIELLEERADLIRRRVSRHARVIVGDARRLIAQVPDQVALCLTSPPYMTKEGHPQNPLTGYQTMDGNYAHYIAELGGLFGRVAALLRPDGRVVINVADQVGPTGVTPLVRDLANGVSDHLTLRESVEVVWDERPDGIGQDFCLVFTKTLGPAT